MSDRLSRRQVLKRIAVTGAVIGGAACIAKWRYDPGGSGLDQRSSERQVRDFTVAPDSGPQLAIAKSSRDPAELVRRAIDALGGMGRFVARGDVVAVKPNIGWDRLPVNAANTNPLVVAEVVRLAFEAGAKKVVVSDVSCNEANRSFQRSGIWRACHELGATVVLPAEHWFRQMRVRGDAIDQWPIYTPLIDADKVINVPVAKHHSMARYTGAMKGWYGILGGQRNRLHQNLDVSIADLATFLRPTLTVVDATRVLLRNGPQGGNVDDTREMHQVIASLDQVAADAYGATLIGEKAENLKYLALAHERGVGNQDWKAVPHVEI